MLLTRHRSIILLASLCVINMGYYSYSRYDSHYILGVCFIRITLLQAITTVLAMNAPRKTTRAAH